ncbi:hypothetical protein C8R45DRAFT_829853 [Mycena sanguinolenta]|nr:hypothetical protein C8R45DRAFT_829853 [Mycena sanguinolenta]
MLRNNSGAAIGCLLVASVAAFPSRTGLSECSSPHPSANCLTSCSDKERTLSPTWDIGRLDDVFIDVHNTGINYQLNGSRADEQWSALVPARDGLVQLGKEIFMISMYHQLKCLDIIRREYVAGSVDKTEQSAVSVGPTAQHCLNYIRQMILCRGDRHLERVVDPTVPMRSRSGGGKPVKIGHGCTKRHMRP